MDIREVLSDIIPTVGFPVAAKVLGAKVQHRVKDSVAEIVAVANQLDREGDDAYFGIGTLIEKRRMLFDGEGNPVMQQSDDGKTSWHKYEIRTIENTQAVRVLHLDVDVHESGLKKTKPVYPTTRDALADMQKLRASLGFPDPTIVSTGSGGLHVYWLIEENLDRDTWKVLASKWRKVVTALAPMVADRHILEDCTRVYRVPGTHRHKDGTLREIKVLLRGTPMPVADYTAKIESKMELLGISPGLSLDKAPAFLDALGTNILQKKEKDFPPLKFEKLLKSCQVIRGAVEDQANAPEPVWRAMLMTLRLCGDPEAIHLASQNHPDYSRDATDRKVAAIKVEGPATCAHFNSLTEGACAGCPHWGKITSPAQVGVEIEEAPAPTLEVVSEDGGIKVVTLSNPPFPYKRTKDHTIVLFGMDEDEDTLPEIVSEYDMYPTHRISDRAGRDEYTLWKVHFPLKGWEDHEFMASALSDTRKMYTELMTKGIFVAPANVKKVHAFMVAYLQHLQKQSIEDKVFTKLGWNDENRVFVLNNKTVTRDGVITSAMNSKAFNIVPGIGTCGTLDNWKEAMKFYDDLRYRDQQFAFLAGFASALMPFSPISGVVVNLDGKPGTGKTTVLHAINSVWGNSKDLMLSGGKSGSTVTGRYQKLAAHNNLPVTFDEITTLSGEHASDFVHSISQGQGKQRAKGYGTMETWATAAICTSNGSLFPKISAFKSDSAGENVRIYELYLSKQAIHTKAEADAFNRTIRENYGWAGEVFAQALVKNADKLPGLVASSIAKVDMIARVDSSERFRSALVGMVWVAGTLANKLGLINWNVESVINGAIGHLSRLREVTSDYDRSATDVLGEFLNSHLSSTLIVMNAGIGRLSGTADVLHEPINQLSIRLEKDKDLLYVQIVTFKQFCAKIGADFYQIEQDLLASGVLLDKNKNKKLGANTVHDRNQTRCWLINNAHVTMAGVVPLPVLPSTMPVALAKNSP
jgi:hypothetical protein